MKKFLFYIVSSLFFSFLVLEIIVRVFSLAGHTLPIVNIDDNKLLKPGISKVWVRGGMGEIRSTYDVNSTGWNSTIDYDTPLDSSILKIALIGDSYVEGFHTDAKSSIGRQLEQELNGKVVVHEFGRAGANIVDHALLYQNKIKGSYDHVFMLVTDKDFNAKKASYFGRGSKIPKSNLLRKVYTMSHGIRYLNINHKLGIKLERMLGKSKNKKASSPKAFLKKLNTEALQKIDNSVVFIYEYDKLSADVFAERGYKLLKVDHKIAPKDCGFDGHWNINGRLNCANSIIDYLKLNTK